MSKIGQKKIQIPADVKVILEGAVIKIEGPKGALDYSAPSPILVDKKNDYLIISPKKSELKKKKKIRALWGTVRATLNNMIQGVSRGFKKELELVGVGFRANPSGNNLVLSLGYSHPIEIAPPPGVSLKINKNIISVEGIDSQKVGETAAKIKNLRPPEPYKGTGIKYVDEEIKRKPGKAVAKESAEGE